jgi:23S rRNA pseudoU1915 N3-methylase RlmH
MEITQIITYGSTIVLLIGGIYTIREQIKKQRMESQEKIIQAIKQEINPMKAEANKNKEAINIDLAGKQTSIDDLWKDLETMEDHLSKVETSVAHNTGVLDTTTPLLNEVRAQIELLRAKIEAIVMGVKYT